MTSSTAALERALDSLDVRAGHTLRPRLAPGHDLRLGTDEMTLVYVREGEITGDFGGDGGCRVDGPTGHAERVRGRRTLLRGDAILSLGCRDLVVTSQSGAELTVVRAETTRPSAGLPPLVLVDDFARLEPAATALAESLTPPTPGAPARPGDGVVCRTMVRTVLLSAVRAWAASGGADRWPARASDPFLSRVTDAIAAAPGRDWSIEQLAALAVMSRSVFAERFREELGRSPAGYVTDVRMAEAKRLLDAGAAVSEVSRALGYGSDEGFRRAFRRHVGVAPSAWRAGRRELTA